MAVKKYRIIIFVIILNTLFLLYCYGLVKSTNNKFNRLPNKIWPLRYNISLEQYNYKSKTNFTEYQQFYGDVYIEIYVRAVTNKIVLHSKNLVYQQYELYHHKGNAVDRYEFRKIATDNRNEKLTLTLPFNLSTSEKYFLHFKYKGSMLDQKFKSSACKGFYEVVAACNKLQETTRANTHLKPNYARRVFPCFDEPQFKARFDITIRHDEQVHSFSNSPLQQSVKNGDIITDTFVTTPKMSTYHLAILCADYQRSGNNSIGIITRGQYNASTLYSLAVAEQILNDLEKYLNSSYYKIGIDKLDIVAIPYYFWKNTENWGLIFMDENLILHSERSMIRDKQNTATELAAVLSYQWFGNLVTCEWWSHLWIQEGITHYFKYFLKSPILENFNMQQLFFIDVLQPLMLEDAFEKPKMISNNVNFAPIYEFGSFSLLKFKGSALMLMMHDLIGSDDFEKALKKYLSLHQYRNTQTSDLSYVFQQYAKKDIKSYAVSFLRTFTEQPGFPLVTIELEKTGKKMFVDQMRFFFDPPPKQVDYLYTIPITFTTSYDLDFNRTKPRIFLKSTEKNAITVELESKANWIIANIQARGYYRVNYDVSTWLNIQKALTSHNYSGIHVLNRAKIVDDILSLARVNVVPYTFVFEVLSYLKTEKEYLPWATAFRGLEYFRLRFGAETTNYGIFITYLTEEILSDLGYEERSNDNNMNIYLRSEILAWLCRFGNIRCINKMFYYVHHDFELEIPINILDVAYCVVIREGEHHEFESLKQRYMVSEIPAERKRLLNALACTKQKAYEYYHFVLSDEVQRSDKYEALIQLISQNVESATLVLDLITDNVTNFVESLGGIDVAVDVVYQISSQSLDEHDHFKMKYLQRQLDNGLENGKLDSTVQVMEANENWCRTNLAAFMYSLVDYLQSVGMKNVTHKYYQRKNLFSTY